MSRSHSRSPKRQSRSPPRSRPSKYDDERDRRRHKDDYNSRASGRDRSRERDRDRDKDRDRDRERRKRRDEERGSRRRSRSREMERRHRSRSPKPSTSTSQTLSRPKSRSGSESPKGEKPPPPNFASSGLLAAETNNFKGVILKYNEPPEARKCLRNWRVYVFKDGKEVDMHQLNRQSAYLIGRDKIVCDIPAEHPSTSKQHAVIQFRQIWEKDPETGREKGSVKPFVIDLESANGTTVNDEAIPTSRYYELRTGDVIKFAFSSREYVMLLED